MTDRVAQITGTGAAVGASLQGSILGLWNASRLWLTSVGGTDNVVTATVTPALNAGIVDGMSFYFTPALSNTGAMTLAINGEAAIDLLDSQADPLINGALQGGITYEIVYSTLASGFLVMGTTQASKVLAYEAFTANGTWTKPAGAPASSWVFIEVWAGGGGGHTAGGGGGGAYNSRLMLLSALGGTETVTIGAGGVGGASATAGGTTSFGSHISAYGGAAASNGGGGGGAMSAGSGDTGGAPGGGFSYTGSDSGTDTFEIPIPHSSAGGGKGAGSINVVGDSDTGGGGGAINSNGGKSRMGGGGGAGNGYVGGVSLFGGNGGDSGSNGVAPGGGGGYNGGDGARGECRVWVIG